MGGKPIHGPQKVGKLIGHFKKAPGPSPIQAPGYNPRGTKISPSCPLGDELTPFIQVLSHLAAHDCVGLTATRCTADGVDSKRTKALSLAHTVMHSPMCSHILSSQPSGLRSCMAGSHMDSCTGAARNKLSYLDGD